MIKKTIFTLALVFAYTSLSYSFNITAGVKGGYFSWEPYIKEIEEAGMEDIDRGDGYLVGPVVSLGILPDLSVSAVYLFGEQNTAWTTPEKHWTQDGANIYQSETAYITMERNDLDVVIGYKLMSRLQVFAGYKYQKAEMTINSMSRLYVDVSEENQWISHDERMVEMENNGPAVGAGYTFPFGEWYFASVNLSGLYMTGTFKTYSSGVRYYLNNFGAPDTFSDAPFSFDVKMAGINFEPSIGVKIAESGAFATLGARYQLLRTRLESTGDEKITEKWMSDKIYGVFLTVMYIIL